MSAEHRYVQPQNAQEAMELIQKLFNQYRPAPLTPELMAYHNNLIARLEGDIRQAAVAEGSQERLKDLDSMTSLMKDWTSIRLSGRPFAGKMRHFKFVSDQHQHFKSRVHKIKGTSDHRAARH